MAVACAGPVGTITHAAVGTPAATAAQIRSDQFGHAIGESGTAYLTAAHPAPHTGWAVLDVTAG